MGDLQKAINDYIKSRTIVDNAEGTLKKLNDEYQKQVTDPHMGSTIRVEDAENIYETYEKIGIHEKEIEQANQSLKDQENTIIGYLKHTSGKQIQTMHMFPGQFQERTVSFSLDGENLSCNIMKFSSPNNR